MTAAGTYIIRRIPPADTKTSRITRLTAQYTDKKADRPKDDMKGLETHERSSEWPENIPHHETLPHIQSRVNSSHYDYEAVDGEDIRIISS